MKVLHTGGYGTGHAYSHTEEMDEPATLAELGSVDFADLVWQDTGDGVLERTSSWYEAVVVEATNPDFINKRWEWFD